MQHTMFVKIGLVVKKILTNDGRHIMAELGHLSDLGDLEANFIYSICAKIDIQDIQNSNIDILYHSIFIHKI